MIESQVGNTLDRKTISRDIHSIYQMKLFEDVQAEVKELEGKESKEKSYQLLYRVRERPRLMDVKLEGVFLVESSVLEEERTQGPGATLQPQERPRHAIHC